jgi:hypothetical protein
MRNHQVKGLSPGCIDKTLQLTGNDANAFKESLEMSQLYSIAEDRNFDGVKIGDNFNDESD